MTDTSRMGKMFGLSSFWESRASEKITNGDTKYAMAQGVPITSFWDSKSGEKIIKRKRDVDEIVLKEEDIQSRLPQNAKRRKQELKVVVPSQPAPVSATTDTVLIMSETELNNKMEARLDGLLGVIDSQLSLEILIKHEEARLINQELAKCQIALEQLRRCHLIPYPTSKASPFDAVDISNGTGPAIEPAQGAPRPEWAAPYGVVDGPYTKHYAKWLIPDQKFDGFQADWTFNDEGVRSSRQMAEGRTTRNSFAESSIPLGGRSRTQRGSSSQKLQALSSGYPQPKGKAGPCTLKRADGQLVKLVCQDCHREDFSSTQGFINHCRIAHKRDYKSHEEAAIACGEPIELDEVGGIVGDEKSPTSATGLVHPLIRSSHTDKETYLNLMSHIGASIKKFHLGELPGVKSIPTSTPSTPNKNFVSSSDAPFLSNLMKNQGSSINLSEIVTQAKTKIEFEELSSNEEDDSDAEKTSTNVQHRGGMYDGASDFPPVMRVPARSTNSSMSPAPFGRPVSSKGLDRKSGISPRLSYATPINTAATHHNRHAFSVVDAASHHDDVFDREGDTSANSSEGPSFIDLSPNTVASNNDLPALVSDDGEYDEDNDDDGKSLASEDDESEDSDVAEISIEDGETAEPTVVARTARRLKKEEKHVTFVSPVKDATPKKDKRGRK